MVDVWARAGSGCCLRCIRKRSQRKTIVLNCSIPRSIIYEHCGKLRDEFRTRGIVHRDDRCEIANLWWSATVGRLNHHGYLVENRANANYVVGLEHRRKMFGQSKTSVAQWVVWPTPPLIEAKDVDSSPTHLQCHSISRSLSPNPAAKETTSSLEDLVSGMMVYLTQGLIPSVEQVAFSEVADEAGFKRLVQPASLSRLRDLSVGLSSWVVPWN